MTSKSTSVNAYGVYPFDYISPRDQFDGATVVMMVGPSSDYIITNPWDSRTCFIGGDGTEHVTTPPIRWKIVYRDDTYFNMFADGDTQRPANHAWSHDNLSAYPYNTDDSRTWFSLYIADGKQIGMKAYEYDWPQSGLYLLWNNDYGGMGCAWPAMDNPSLTPILKIVTSSPYVAKFTSTNPKDTIDCCTKADSLDALSTRVCKDRKLVGQGTLCDQFMQSYCTGEKLTGDPLCSCFQKSLELQSNPLLAPLSISPICVSPCTNNGYRTQGFIQENAGGCGHSCVQIQSVADQATATKFSQQMNCPDGASPVHVDPTGQGTVTHGTGGSGSGGTSGDSGSASGTSGAQSGSITDLWHNNANFRTGTYIVGGIVGLYIFYRMFFAEDD